MTKLERHVFSSCRILYGQPEEVQIKYENLTNLILSYGGTIHGSQYNFTMTPEYGSNHITVYFQLPTNQVYEFLNEEKALVKETENPKRLRLTPADGSLDHNEWLKQHGKETQ